MFSALLASNARLPFVLADDGSLPRWVARRSRSRQVPIASLSLTGVCAWAAWQQYVHHGTTAVTYCLVAVGGSVLLYRPLARRSRRVQQPSAYRPC